MQILRNSLSSVAESIGTFGLGQTNGGNPRICLGEVKTGDASSTLLKAAVGIANNL